MITLAVTVITIITAVYTIVIMTQGIILVMITIVINNPRYNTAITINIINISNQIRISVNLNISNGNIHSLGIVQEKKSAHIFRIQNMVQDLSVTV